MIRWHFIHFSFKSRIFTCVIIANDCYYISICLR